MERALVTRTLRWPNVDLSKGRQNALLAATYACLTAVFLVVYGEPVWAALAAFLGASSTLVWWLRAQAPRPEGGDRGQLVGVRGRLDDIGRRLVDFSRPLGSLPALYLALPLAIMASWFAGQNALDKARSDTYWSALYIWLGAIALFLMFLMPWRRILVRPNLRRTLASVPWPEVGAVALLTLIAFAARTYDLHEPNPFSGDEANFANQGREVLRGTFRNMFGTGVPFGQPSMYYFVLARFFKVLGIGVLAARAPSVVLGVTMVPLLYLLLRELFADRRVALVGAAFLAVYHLHIHFSRLALNNMTAAWVAVLALYFAARATRTQKPLDFGLAGAAAGLCLYTFIGGRAVPLVAGLFLAWVVLMNWRFLRDNYGNFLVLLAGFAVVALPEGMFFINQPDEFFSGHRWANIFANGWLEEARVERGDGTLLILYDQVKSSFGVLAIDPELYHHYNPGRPLIDAVSRLLFVVGVFVALYRIKQPGYFMFLALLVVTVVLGSVVVFPPVSSARLVTLTPAVAALVAIGLVALADLVVRLRPRLARFAPFAIVVVVIVIAAVNLQFYFGTYLPNDRYVSGANDITYAAGSYMAELGPEYAGYWFGAPRIYAGDPTMRFLGRNRTYVNVPADAVQLPDVGLSEPHATFMFMEQRRGESEAIIAACPGGTWREFYDDFDERVLFYAYERQDAPACLAAADLFLPTPAPDATPELPTLEGNPNERDAQRRADLAAIAVALEQHYDEEQTYPTTNGTLQTLCAYTNLDTGCALSAYLDEIPIDPIGDAARYGYFFASDGRRFSIFAGLEGSAEPIDDGCFFRDSFADRLPVVLCVSGLR